ncbi:hypothetical protein D918_09084 [Trichuris suis]|nr:hypothetical protein D918_09084 [Trichuris suis]
MVAAIRAVRQMTKPAVDYSCKICLKKANSYRARIVYAAGLEMSKFITEDIKRVHLTPMTELRVPQEKLRACPKLNEQFYCR